MRNSKPKGLYGTFLAEMKVNNNFPNYVLGEFGVESKCMAICPASLHSSKDRSLSFIGEWWIVYDVVSKLERLY